MISAQVVLKADAAPHLAKILDRLILGIINASLYNNFVQFFWQKLFGAL